MKELDFDQAEEITGGWGYWNGGYESGGGGGSTGGGSGGGTTEG